MIFYTPVWQELQRKQPANTTFPCCRTPSLKADAVWSASKSKTARGDSLKVCQGCACIFSRETVFWNYYVLGSSCCGTAGELINLASRQSTASLSCCLLEPSPPLFLSRFLGLPLQLAQRDPPCQQYWVVMSGPQAPAGASAEDAVGCSAAADGADMTARAAAFMGAQGEAVQVRTGLARSPSAPAVDPAEEVVGWVELGFPTVFWVVPLSTHNCGIGKWLQLLPALDGVSPSSPHVGLGFAPWWWSSCCRGAGGLQLA